MREGGKGVQMDIVNVCNEIVMRRERSCFVSASFFPFHSNYVNCLREICVRDYFGACFSVPGKEGT